LYLFRTEMNPTISAMRIREAKGFSGRTNCGAGRARGCSSI
jgi:hypothetical protein